MISITINKPQKLKPTPLCTQSGFVSFTYDSEIVEYLKNITHRVYLADTKTWEIPASAIPALCNQFIEHDITLTGEWEIEKQIISELPENFKFKTVPFNHQVEGVLYGMEHSSFLLGDDQGLGKTKQLIDLAVLRKQTEGMKHCLIVCGVNGNKYNWVDEVKKHSYEESWVLGTRFTKRKPVKMVEGSAQDKLDDLKNLPDAFFIITNIETLRALSVRKTKAKYTFPIAERIQKLVDMGEIGLVAFDEAHKAKNPTSQQGMALLSISPTYAIPMSGTFLMNNPLDLYFPLYWTGYETHSFWQYKQHYCVMGGYSGQDVVGYKNLHELRELLDKVMLRRLKQDVLDLPPKVHVIEYVEMSVMQKKIYDEVQMDLRRNIDKLRISHDPLSQLIRLRQATGYPGILSTIVTESAKLDRMVEMVEEIVDVDQKVIIYSQWEQMTLKVRELLSKYNPGYITGNVAAEDRMAQIKRFQEDPKCHIIIGTIGAMGTGITLSAASNVMFLDEPWNRALKDQAEDRAHRIGTKGTVRVITLITKNTIDEKILNIVYQKGKMADLLVDGKVESGKAAQLIDYMLS